MPNQLLLELARIRDANYWTDEQLARELGVSKSTISRVMRGERNPGEDFLSAVTNRFPRLNELVLAYLFERAKS